MVDLIERRYSSELQHNQLFRSEVTGSKHHQPLLNLNQSSQMESGSRETWRSEMGQIGATHYPPGKHVTIQLGKTCPEVVAIT